MNNRKTLTIIMVISLMLGSSLTLAQTAEELLPKAIQLEEVKGELEKAIEVYQAIIDKFPENRPIAARAQLHVGICYEKLGHENAKKAYEKLIADFADQEEIVAVGKNRLAYINTGIKVAESDELIMRQVWSPAEDTYGVSPNGRYFNYIDWNAITVAVKDIETGKTWDVGKKGTWMSPSEFPDNSIWSHDGKQIAYFWFIGEGLDRRSELHIVNLDGSEDHILIDTSQNTPWPITWSSDGKYILAHYSSGDKTNPEDIVNQIVLVAVSDGSIRVIKSFEKQQGAHGGDISPDNQYIVYHMQQEENTENMDIFLAATDGSYEKRIVTNPANDRSPLWIPDGSGIVFISDRMVTKDLWTLQLKNGIPQGEPEILKSDLGESTKLLGITNDESLVYMKINARTDIFSAKLNFNTGEILSKPTRISNIDESSNFKPIWSPEGRYIAYLTMPPHRVPTLGRRLIFIIRDTKTGTDRKLMTDLYGSPNGFWRQPRWSPDGKYLLVQGRTKDKLQGFFLVDIGSGLQTPILVKDMEPRIGATDIGRFPVFSNDGTEIYYLSEDLKMIIKYNIADKSEYRIYNSEEQILQFKLSPDESSIVFGYCYNCGYALKSIPSSGGDTSRLAEFKENVTASVISWTTDNKYVIVEAKTSRKPDAHEIMRVPVDGGEPERVLLSKDLFTHGSVNKIEMDPYGKQALFEIWVGNVSVIWALDNLFEN